MNFGKVVASFRKKWAMEQEDLGKAVGVSKTYISLIENDKRAPLRVLKKIADFFEVPFAYFMVEALKDPALKRKGKKNQSALDVTEPIIQVLVDRLVSKKEPKKRNAKKVPPGTR